jgi:DNA-nicking Smr family endonuclease
MAKRVKPPKLADWHLWLEVKASVTPLRPEPPEPERSAPLPLPPEDLAPRIRLPSTLRPEGRKGLAPVLPVMPPKPAPWASEKPIEPKLRRKLRRGQMALDATIDLHGMRQAEARAALIRFIKARAASGDRTVLVITGKGLKKLGDDASVIIERGVLRSMLPVWLGEPDLRPLIAGWDASAQGHGGEGAFYVRLKRVRP